MQDQTTAAVARRWPTFAARARKLSSGRTDRISRLRADHRRHDVARYSAAVTNSQLYGRSSGRPAASRTLVVSTAV